MVAVTTVSTDPSKSDGRAPPDCEGPSVIDGEAEALPSEVAVICVPAAPVSPAVEVAEDSSRDEGCPEFCVEVPPEDEDPPEPEPKPQLPRAPMSSVKRIT